MAHDRVGGAVIRVGGAIEKVGRVVGRVIGMEDRLKAFFILQYICVSLPLRL